MEVDDYFDNEEIDEFKNAKNKLKVYPISA